jgi:hypothetical protein
VAAGGENSGGQTLATRSKGKLKTVGPQHKKKFAAETAVVAKTSKSSINQELRRAEILGDDLTGIVGTSLDKGVEMDALIKMPAHERVALVERAVAGEKVSARQVAKKPKHDKNPADPNNAPAASEVAAAAEPQEYVSAGPLSIKELIAVVTDDEAAMKDAFTPILAWPPHWRAALKERL